VEGASAGRAVAEGAAAEGAIARGAAAEKATAEGAAAEKATAEQVAIVARAKREVMLRAHRHRLRREDLEDCMSQAVLELLAGARVGQRFSSRAHIANVLEQRFLSRVQDRRRALGGRSPLQAALEGALPLGGFGEREVELADPRAEVHPLVTDRLQLRRVVQLAPRLTPDQRLVLACQIALDMDRAEFCCRFGWSFEKYRKVAQRARARLRGLMDAEVWDVDCEQFAPLGEREPAVGAALDLDPMSQIATPMSHSRGGKSPRPVSHSQRRGRNREIGTHL
jgi:DNA-directed RNA polymerase specialized sigma24 family protein